MKTQWIGVEKLESRIQLSIPAFTPPINYPVPYAPKRVAIADLRGDGNNDIITANYQNDSVTVLLGNGDTTFAPPVSYPVGNKPKTLLVADVNGDGLPDVITGNAKDGTISVLIGYGDGRLAPQQVTYVGGYINSVVAGKFTGDGDVDLVVAVGGDATGPGDLVFLAGNGDGTFQPPTLIAMENSPQNLVAADFNDDGNMDFAETNGGDDTLTVFLGNGDGTFAAKPPITIGANYAENIAAADVNGDGIPDLIVGYRTPTSGTIEFLLGNGDGTFHPGPQILSIPGPKQGGFIVGDLGNGAQDVLVGSDYSDNIGIFFNNGDGTFKPEHTMPFNSPPTDAAIGDLNNDGKPDVVVSVKTDAVEAFINGPLVMQSGGMVTAVGTTKSGSGSISYSNGQVVLVIGGQMQSFSGVSGVNINPGTGADNFMIGQNLPPITVAGGTGEDTITSAGNGDSISSSSAQDQITLTGDSSTVSGGTGNDTLSVTGDDNMLIGGAKGALFVNSVGSGDTLMGGAGLNFAQYNPNDSMENIFEIYDPPAPTASSSPIAPADGFPSIAPDDETTVTAEISNDILRVTGTAGPDSIVVNLTAGDKLRVKSSGVVVDKFSPTDVTGVVISGGAGADTISIASSVTLSTTVKGGGGADSISGGGGDNVLVGGGGSDTLVGGAGTNLLVPDGLEVFSSSPSGDSDSLDGGTGYSIADFSHREDPLSLSDNGSASSGDSSDGEQITIATDVSAIWGGTGNDTIVGGAAGKFLSGGAGNNSIHGGGMGDVLVGGTGMDTVVVAAEPVSLFLADGQPCQYSGVNDPSEDILNLDGMDTLV